MSLCAVNSTNSYHIHLQYMMHWRSSCSKIMLTNYVDIYNVFSFKRTNAEWVQRQYLFKFRFQIKQDMRSHYLFLFLWKSVFKLDTILVWRNSGTKEYNHKYIPVRYLYASLIYLFIYFFAFSLYFESHLHKKVYEDGISLNFFMQEVWQNPTTGRIYVIISPDTLTSRCYKNTDSLVSSRFSYDT